MNLIFNSDTQIYSAEISNRTPQNLYADVEFTNSLVTVKPTLLNKYDSVTIAMLTNSNTNICIDARIAGIKEVGPWKGGQGERIVAPALAALFGLPILFILSVFCYLSVDEMLKKPKDAFIGGAFLIVFFVSMYVIEKIRKRFKHPMD
jgi:hypothetical protein